MINIPNYYREVKVSQFRRAVGLYKEYYHNHMSLMSISKRQKLAIALDFFNEELERARNYPSTDIMCCSNKDELFNRYLDICAEE